jgi:hypothetical protein
MNIEIAIDTDPAPDPIEPRGNLRIVDDAGRVIERPAVWLDDWLEGLVDGLQAIGRREPCAEIELLSETEPLVFLERTGGIEVRHGDARVLVRSADELTRGVTDAIRFALDVYKHHPHLENHESWMRLRAFASVPKALDPWPC